MATIIIVGIIIFVIWALIRSAPTGPPITLGELEAFYHLGGTELQKEERWEKYFGRKGRTVVGEGIVKSVSPLQVEYGAEFNYSTTNYIVVTVKSILTTGPVEVKLWFSENQKKKLLLLKKGQQIKFSARLYGYEYNSFEAYGMHLHNCWLL